MTYTLSIRNRPPITVATRGAAEEFARTLRWDGHDVYIINNNDPAGGTDHATEEVNQLSRSGQVGRVNKYAADCAVCGSTVPAKGGNLTKLGRRWSVTHLACADGRPRVIATTFGVTGNTVYQNSRGRCEDAPCCGCCSY